MHVKSTYADEEDDYHADEDADEEAEAVEEGEWDGGEDDIDGYNTWILSGMNRFKK